MGLVLDCADPDGLARFWGPTLDYEIVGGAGAYVLLLPKEPGAPQLLLQRVPEAKATKNRMHLDLHVADPEAEAQRLIALGATRTGDGTLGDIAWITMTDPEGNEFDIGRR